METTWKRRKLLAWVTAGVASMAAPQLVACSSPVSAAIGGHEQALAGDLTGEHSAMLVYPEMTLLDLVGAHACLRLGKF